MTLRRLYAALALAVAFTGAPALVVPHVAVARDDDGGGRGDRGDRDDDGDDDRGDDDDDDRGSRYGGDGSRGSWRSNSRSAREAVSAGYAAPLSAVLPSVLAAVPGRLLDVDLLQSASGAWLYQLVVLTHDRKYREVTVDARSRRILRIRNR